MKKTFVLITFTFIIFFICSAVALAVPDSPYVDVYVNGKFLESDQPAMIIEGRTFVPLRAIVESLNCFVYWDADKQSIQINNEVTEISMKIMFSTMYKTDRRNRDIREAIVLDVPPNIYNERTLVPARAIAEALYADVKWNEALRRVDITLEYDYIGMFNSYNLAEVKKDGKYGYINEARYPVIPAIYDAIGEMGQKDNAPTDGLVSAKKDGKWGFLNTDGKIVIPFLYDLAFDFENGYTVVFKDNKSGIIDITGKEITPIKYDGCDYFSEGRARVTIGDKWGYVDTDGNEIIPLKYDNAFRFEGSKAKVIANGNELYIDLSGNPIN